jgi:hypothetical protein
MFNQDKEDLGAKFGRLFKTAKNAALKVEGAIEEALQDIETIQESADATQLKCISNGVFDFDLVERDIQQINKQVEVDRATTLGSYLIIKLEGSGFLVDIETYVQRQGKTFRKLVKTEISRFKHLPSDVADELKSSGEVRLHLED